MQAYSQPEVGSWYKDQFYHQPFEVIAENEEEDSVEVQYFAGEIGAFDFDSWHQLEPKRISPPKDWSGPFEISLEDLTNYSDPYFLEQETDNDENLIKGKFLS